MGEWADQVMAPAIDPMGRHYLELGMKGRAGGFILEMLSDEKDCHGA